MTTIDLENDLKFLGDTPKETFALAYEKFTAELQAGKYDEVRINQTSLANYIEDTIIKLDRAQGEYKTTLVQNLKRAERIQHIADYTQGSLYQVINESDFGRKYYVGLNLQNSHKMLRHAALGDCHEYDIKNSVYQFKMMMVKDIDPTFKTPYILEYMDFKQKHRERLAEVVFGDTNLSNEFKQEQIKQALTAVGFGAQARESVKYYHSSLHTIFRFSEQYERFVGDEFVRGFIDEQTKIDNLIFGQVKDDFKQSKYRELLSNKRGISRSATMAFLYQHWERNLMRGALKIFPAKKLLLEVHDGFYCDKLTTEERLELLQYFKDQGVDVEHTELVGYSKNKDSVKHEEYEHRQRILEEEQRARRLYGDSFNQTH